MTPEELAQLEMLMAMGYSEQEALTILMSGSIPPDVGRSIGNMDPKVGGILSDMGQALPTAGGPWNGPDIQYGGSPAYIPPLSQLTYATGNPTGDVSQFPGIAEVNPFRGYDSGLQEATTGYGDVQTWTVGDHTGYYAPNSPTGGPEYPPVLRSPRSILPPPWFEPQYDMTPVAPAYKFMPDRGPGYENIEDARAGGSDSGKSIVASLVKDLIGRGMQGARQKQSRKPATQPGRATSTPVKTAVQKAKSVATPAPKPAPKPALAPVRGGSVNKLAKAAEPKTSTRGKAR